MRHTDHSRMTIIYRGPKSCYLERELSWVNESEFGGKINDEDKLVVLIGEDIREVFSLYSWKMQPCFVYLYADETYRFFRSLLIQIAPSVRGVIRSYVIPKQDAKKVLKSLLQGLKTASIEFKKSRLRNGSEVILLVLAGLVIRFRQESIKIIEAATRFRRITNIWLPLGYTNNFCQGFDTIFENNAKNYSSLIQFTENFEQEIMNLKSNSFFFCGQQGNVQRKIFLEKLDKLLPKLLKEFTIKDSFGGTPQQFGNDSDGSYRYCNGLVRSRFAVCPPGNYSGETFRFWEALASWCIPLEMDSVFGDPAFQRRNLVFWNGNIQDKAALLYELQKLIERGSVNTENQYALQELRRDWVHQCQLVNRKISEM